METLNRRKLEARLRRARGIVGIGIRYRLGKGGINPRKSRPDDNGFCDCSGAVSWCLGISRHQRPKDKPWSTAIPWIETTAIYRDAKGEQLLFQQISKPVPGCIVVYPDRWLGVRQGHVAIVSTVSMGSGNIKQLGIVDCASHKGEAIRERDGMFMLKRGAIFVVLQEDFTL